MPVEVLESWSLSGLLSEVPRLKATATTKYYHYYYLVVAVGTVASASTARNITVSNLPPHLQKRNVPCTPSKVSGSQSNSDLPPIYAAEPRRLAHLCMNVALFSLKSTVKFSIDIISRLCLEYLLTRKGIHLSNVALLELY